MSFLSPLFLLGGLAAAVPVLLHLLRRQPETRLRFSAVHLLKQAPVEHTSRRRLRELLLLAMRVGAILLLALAFGRPFFASGLTGTGATTVVVLDTSMSLSAPGQFDRARQLAVEAIDAAATGDLVAVVTFADAARVAAAPAADRASARAAVQAAAVSAGATSYRAALSAASDLLRGGAGTIVVVTDLQETGWDTGDRVTVPASAVVRVVDVGAPPANLAVTSVRASADRVNAVIQNTGDAPVTAQVRLTVTEGASTPPGAARVVSETTIPVGAGQAAPVGFPLPQGRSAAVEVVDATGAPMDNARYLVIDDARRPAVLVVTGTGDLAREAFYVEQALVAPGADGRAYEVAGVAGADLAGWEASRLDRHTAVVLLSTRGIEHRGRQLLAAFLRRGGGLLVGAGPEVDGEVLDELLSGAKTALVPEGAAPRDRVARTWAPTDVRHPVVRAFGAQGAALGRVRFERVRQLRPDACQLLARFTSGEPALVDCPSGDGHAVVVASDLDNRGNDFPLHASFVPFLHETVRYLAGGQRRTAEYFVGDVPAGVPPQPGVAVVGDGQPSQLVAVNVDPAEVDTGRLTTEEFQTAVAPGAGDGVAVPVLRSREQEERQHIWQYVLAAMLLLLLAESYVATRVA